jgi:hypothetical protein
MQGQCLSVCLLWQTIEHISKQYRCTVWPTNALSPVPALTGGTFALLKTFLPAKCGISVTLVDITDHDAVAAAFTPRTKVDCDRL